MSTTVGTIQYLVEVDTKSMKAQLRSVDKEIDNMSDTSENTAKRSNKAFESMGKIGLGFVVAGAVAAGAAIIANVGGAIKRVDTLNNSSRTFQNMGFDAATTDQAMKALEKSITGLPTPLDSAVRSMTALAATYGDISKGQKVFSAINNAVLGFGGTAEMAENAIAQLSQLPMDGPLDAQTWNSLRNSGLTPVLVAMAKDMGKSLGQMKEEFGQGQLTVEDFTNALIKMNTDGGGGMVSLEKIARDSTSGVQTGWANMQTAITRGLSSIITAIGASNISGAMSSIGKAFETSLKAVAGFMTFIMNNEWALAMFTGAVIGLAVAIGVALAPVIWGAVVAFGALVIAALPFIAIGAAIGLVAFAIIKNWDTLKSWFAAFWEWIKDNWWIIVGILTGGIGLAVAAIIKNFDSIKRVAQSVWNWITGAFGTIGEIGTSVIKGAVNAVLGFAERTINGFINAINKAIGAINSIPGVNIGWVHTINVPKLAEGGIIPATAGGRLAMIGEGGEDEAVIPLSKLDQIMAEGGSSGSSAPIQITLNVDGMMARSKSDIRWLGDTILEAVDDARKAKGLKPINADINGFVGAR